VTPFPIQNAIDEYRAEAEALQEAGRLWPPLLVRSGRGFEIAPEPDGFDGPSWFGETVRCLRIAAGAYERATAAMDSAVPQLEQERIEPDGEEEDLD
jgi:hypothetical protein